MVVLISGDRHWGTYLTEAVKLHDRLSQLPPGTIVLHGAAKGADTLAGTFATALGLIVIPFPANWDTYGKSAGPIRNREMLDCKPDLVIGFHRSIWTSKGTLDCLQEAAKRGIPVELIQ